MDSVSKVIRAPSLKRGKNDERLCDRIKLDRVLGLTVGSNAALDCSPTNGLLAYPAGCTVVLFNPKRSRQQQHLLNSSRKSVTAVCFSSDGRHLATGESGHAPCVRVWDLEAGASVAEFAGHKYAVNCVAFSPNGKYLVSVGSQHDMIVNVWEWRSGAKLASNKVSARVKAISFAENGAYFVTVGNRHVKFWYLECARVAKQFKEPVPLMGRSAILGEQRNNDFVDVCCGRGQCGDSTYAITRSGLLCEFNHRRLLEKWVELRTPSANCMSVGERLIFIGCADGIVRCFDPSTMQFVTTLPRTHSLGVDVAMGTNIGHMLNTSPTSKYPDTIAVSYDELNGKLTCVYNDHSLYIWDVRDIKRVGKSNSFLYHSACIWGVETPNSLVHMNLNTKNKCPALPQNCFITCSSDDTIRIWNLDENHHIDETSNFKRNIYSKELLKVLYVDPELTYLKDIELSPTTNSEKSTSYDGRNGVRSIRISPDGEQLASGDRSGNIRIHSLRTFQELYQLEAHDAEVLCLEYTQINNSRDPAKEKKLLASASRDRLIHVFDVNDEYSFIQTLDDHSSSITSVRFLGSGGNIQMVSCGADKSIIFRQLVSSPGGTENFQRGHNCSGKTTLYDMEVDSNHKHVLTACQDRNIRVYNTQTGKHTKTFKGSASDEGTLIKVSLDSSGIYVATSCTDKTLSVYDYYSGECMATMLGHSELVTGLRFSNDCRYLISASGDGCIFIWKVPHDMVVTMQARLSQQALRMGRKPQAVSNETFSSASTDIFEMSINTTQSIAESADYRFSIGQLPSWAKKQISDPTEITNTDNTTTRVPEPPRGRWAQRVENFGTSQFDTNNITAYSENRLDSDGSKDSSLDSGTEVKSYKHPSEALSIHQNMQHVTMSRGTERGKHTDDSSLGSLRLEDLESTEHDGDVEDYSDGERTSSDHITMYYPENSDTPTDFTVNAMDVEELRKSQRRHKQAKKAAAGGGNGLVNSGLTLKLNHDLAASGASVSGSQDSDDDDDDASTPSGDNADRSLASTLGGSTESLNAATGGKGFLQTALDGPASKVIEGKTKSYSSKHLLNTSGGSNTSPSKDNRNASVIQATMQGKPESKREELERRIEETKRTLQSVGYRSSLKSSQSISDLSRSSIITTPSRLSRQQNSVAWYTPSPSEGLRKACSLSDLSSPTQSKKNIVVSGKMQNSKPQPVPRKLSLPKQSVKSGMGQRSVSTGVLNQSDSESDINNLGGKRLGGLMRPTISSQNKTNNGVLGNGSHKNLSLSANKFTKSGKTGSATRRRLQNSYSSVNLTTVGNEDSSSEEIANSNSSSKPAVPPRPRSISIDHTRRMGRSGSDRESSSSGRAREVTSRLTGGGNGNVHTHDKHVHYEDQQSATKLPPSPLEIPCKDTDTIDITNAELSATVCKQLADQLNKAAENVIQLYKRLSVNDVGTTNGDLSAETMLRGLEDVMKETQRKFQMATLDGELLDNKPEKFLDNSIQKTVNGNNDAEKTMNINSIFNQSIELDKIQNLLTNNDSNNSVMVHMMQQYSDILLNVMQQKVAGSQKKA